MVECHRLSFPQPLVGQLQLHGQPFVRRRQGEAHVLFELLDRVERVIGERGRRGERRHGRRQCGDSRHGKGHPHAPITGKGGDSQGSPLWQDRLELQPEGGYSDRWGGWERDQQQVELAHLAQFRGAGGATGDVPIDAATLVGGQHAIGIRDQPVAGRCMTQHLDLALCLVKRTEFTPYSGNGVTRPSQSSWSRHASWTAHWLPFSTAS